MGSIFPTRGFDQELLPKNIEGKNPEGLTSATRLVESCKFLAGILYLAFPATTFLLKNKPNFSFFFFFKEKELINPKIKDKRYPV